MEFKPSIDESITIPPIDEGLAAEIERNLVGLFRIAVHRKVAKRKHKPVGQLNIRTPKVALDKLPDEDIDEIVEATLKIAANYCANDLDDEEGPITFRIQCHIANPSGRAKRPSFEWTFDPISEEQEIYLSDPEDLRSDPMEKVCERQHMLIQTLHNRTNEMYDQLIKMVKLTQAQMEPQAQIMQMMGYGWIQGIQMQQNAANALAEISQNKEDSKMATERWKIAGTVLQKALPVLAEKGSAFALVQMAKKLGLEGDELKEFMAKAGVGKSADAPAISTAQDVDDSSFQIDEEKEPLATLARALGHFIRPTQWGFITATLDADEFETLRSLLEAKTDRDVLASYDRFIAIDGSKLADIYGKLDTDQAAELQRLGELIGQYREAGAT